MHGRSTPTAPSSASACYKDTEKCANQCDPALDPPFGGTGGSSSVGAGGNAARRTRGAGGDSTVGGRRHQRLSARGSNTSLGRHLRRAAPERAPAALTREPAAPHRCRRGTQEKDISTVQFPVSADWRGRLQVSRISRTPSVKTSPSSRAIRSWLPARITCSCSTAPATRPTRTQWRIARERSSATSFIPRKPRSRPSPIRKVSGAFCEATKACRSVVHYINLTQDQIDGSGHGQVPLHVATSSGSVSRRTRSS